MKLEVRNNMTILIKPLNKHNISLETLDSLPKSFQIENSEKLPKKTSKGITSLRVGRTINNLPKYIGFGSLMHGTGVVISKDSSALSNKGIEGFSTSSSSRQVDSLPKIISRNDIKNRLLAYEKKYNKSSDKFYSDWKQGKAIDNLDTLKWATYYEMWKEKYFM